MTTQPDSQASIHLYRLTWVALGIQAPFVDWYSSETQEQAIEAWREDCHRYGVRSCDILSHSIVECHPDTLKPL